MNVMINIKNFTGTAADLMAVLQKHNALNGVFTLNTLEVNIPNLVHGSDDLAEKIRAFLVRIKPSQVPKIEAIRYHRQLTGLGLKESKNWVEANMKEFSSCWPFIDKAK